MDPASPIKPFRVKRFLGELNRFGARRQAESVSRLAYGKQDMAARKLLAERLRDLDLHLYSDTVGNLAGLTRPLDPKTPFVLVGSHLDTAADVGRYGGALGIAAALELLQQRAEGAIDPHIPLGLVCFACGEPARFGIAGLGSRYFTGEIEDGDLEQIDEVSAVGRRPKTVAQVLAEQKIGQTVKRWETLSLFRGGPEQSLRQLPVAAFLELDVQEQPGCDRSPGSLVIISRVGAPLRASITLSSLVAPAHSSATRERGELFALAMDVWAHFEAYCESRPGLARTIVGVSTPGWRWERTADALEIHVEISSTSVKRTNRALAHLQHLFERLTSKRQILLSRFEVVHRSAPVKMDTRLNRALAASARGLKIKNEYESTMLHGNASVMAKRHPAALLRLPCPAGTGLEPHDPEEIARVAAVVRLLLETVKRLNRTESGH